MLSTEAITFLELELGYVEFFSGEKERRREGKNKSMKSQKLTSDIAHRVQDKSVQV